MTNKRKKALLPADEKSKATFRRLELAKQIYHHGLDHCQKPGVVNKIVSINNFHNAIEIVLRATFLHYEIRPDNQLNITFETMLNDVDKYFKAENKKLPYRRELRELHVLRNLTLHAAVEPPSSTMHDWLTFTRRFLILVYRDYFNIDFEAISMLDLIEDNLLKDMLEISLQKISICDDKDSIMYSKIAYEYGVYSIPMVNSEERLHSELHFLKSRLQNSNIYTAVEKVYENISKIKHLVAVLSTGINFIDYKKFEENTPKVYFMEAGNFSCYFNSSYSDVDARWVHNFVVKSIINWQILGLAPKIPDWGREYCEKTIKEEKQKSKTQL
jgi:hypothetical protein